MINRFIGVEKPKKGEVKQEEAKQEEVKQEEVKYDLT